MAQQNQVLEQQNLLKQIQIPLFSLSGPSGVGKNTIRSRILELNPGLKPFRASSTKLPNKYEVENQTYNFLSLVEFEDKIQKNEFLEYEQYAGNYYGTDLQYLIELQNLVQGIVFDIDYRGALSLKECFGSKLVTIFVLPPSFQELENRIRSRKRENDTEEKIIQRLKLAEIELQFQDRFDYVIVNDNLENCVQQVDKIVKQQLEQNKLLQLNKPEIT